MRRRIKKLAYLQYEKHTDPQIPIPSVIWRKPIVDNRMYIVQREETNFIDVPHAFMIEWSETSDIEHGIEPTTYSVYVLNETKAKEIMFDLSFGLRNSESWSIHVPHCKNRKVTLVCIELVDIDTELNTNSLYCEYLEWKAKDWFEATLKENNENCNE